MRSACESHATAVMASDAPGSESNSRPVSTSHTRTVLSAPPVTSRVLSGLKRTTHLRGAKSRRTATLHARSRLLATESRGRFPHSPADFPFALKAKRGMRPVSLLPTVTVFG